MTQLNLTQIGRTLARNAAVLRAQSTLNLTQTQEATGVSRRTLARIEKARAQRRTYKPMLSTVVKLANASGVTVDEFLTQQLTFH